MANNISITSGAGTTLATDDVSGVHYPVQKIAEGIADSAKFTPGRLLTRATYIATTGELTLGTGTGKNRILSFFHGSGVALTYEILEIRLYIKVGHTVGVGQFTMSFSTVESATGTVLNPQPMTRGDAATSASVRSATTGDGTLTGNAFTGFTRPLAAVLGNMEDALVLLYQAPYGQHGEKPITLRASTAEGILVYQNVTSALTTAPIVACDIKWVEY